MSPEQNSENVAVVEQADNIRHDPAFTLDSLSPSTGEVILVIQKGILGALSNHLKNTSSRPRAVQYSGNWVMC